MTLDQFIAEVSPFLPRQPWQKRGPSFTVQVTLCDSFVSGYQTTVDDVTIAAAESMPWRVYPTPWCPTAQGATLREALLDALAIVSEKVNLSSTLRARNNELLYVEQWLREAVARGGVKVVPKPVGQV